MLEGRTPTSEEKKWLDEISDLGCVVCRVFESTYSPASPHHIEGKVKPGAHKITIPLCFLHHQEGSDNDQYTSRHPYKARFEERYATEEELLEMTRQLVEKKRQLEAR